MMKAANVLGWYFQNAGNALEIYCVTQQSHSRTINS